MSDVTTRSEKLEALFDWLMNNEGSDIDGGDLENKCLELGLLVEETYDISKHGNYLNDEWDVQPGDIISVKAKP